MTKKTLLLAVAMISLLSVNAQKNEPVRDPNNKYLVWTSNVRKVQEEKVDSTTESKTESAAQKVKSFMERYFPYRNMCDWEPGMRFMVMPEKKDMVIRTFADSLTEEMVSNMSLRYKIMVYQGFSKEPLHDRVWFHEESTGKAYFFEVPTTSFEDYCFTKFGVPTLAYLGDVDNAEQQLIGRQLETMYGQYNIDVSTTSYGYDKVDVMKGTIVTVKAVGVGSRSYPVKLIVEDKDGSEFYQNVAISRTNSGMRNDEFEAADEIKHTFEGSFRLLDRSADSEQYKQYIGKTVLTTRKTAMINKFGVLETIDRLIEFKITKAEAIPGIEYVLLTLEGHGSTYTKKVTFEYQSVRGENKTGEMREDYFKTLFHVGGIDKENVREANLPDIRSGIVRQGFTEAEVLLALGEPDDYGSSARGTAYTWIYKSETNRTQYTVFFNQKTKRVTSVRR